ncbi:MAG: acyl-CoA dehydrogenase family protein [Myxococcota bacterium]
MIDAEDRALLEDTIKGALADAEPGSDVDSMLVELDWLDLLDAETDDAIDIVFRALGRVDVRSSALDDVLAHALGEKPRDEIAVLLPAFGSWDTPGKTAGGGGGSQGGPLDAQGLITSRSQKATRVLAVCSTGSTLQLATLPLDAAHCSPITGLDPEAGYQSYSFQGEALETASLAPELWQTAIALGQRAIGAQIVGANRTMLDMARTHAIEREQFGNPIAQFQTVRHKLSETLVAVESTEACLVAARDEPNARTAALAKALASRNARIVARHSQQILAGIGFTLEHPFHRFLKRAMTLEGLFGTADEILLEIGRDLLATRSAPTLIEL